MIQLDNLSKIIIENKLLRSLLKIYEKKGESYYYKETLKDISEKLKKQNIQNDVYQLFSFLQIDKITDQRLKTLSKQDLIPQNQIEQKLLNLKIVQRSMINRPIYSIENSFIINFSQTIAKRLYNVVYNSNFRPNSILGQLESNPQEFISKYLALFNQYQNNNTYEKILLITAFYVDFKNLKIFNKDNDLISLILLEGLLNYQFPCFTYISFFEVLNIYREEFLKILENVNFSWSSSFTNIGDLYEVIIKIILTGYEKLQDLVRTYEFRKELNKTNNLEGFILNGSDVFTKDDLRLAHPEVSNSTITRTLARLSKEGKIRLNGKGRSSFWQVIRKDDQQYSFFETDTNF